MAKPTEKQLSAMRKLGLSESEIAELLASDAEIEKGANPFPLTAEQEKVSKQARQATSEKRLAPTIYKLDNTDGKRSRKENATKGGIIAEIFTFLAENSSFSVKNCEITNKERHIAFKIGDDCFELTLVQKRKPKN